MIRCRCQGYFHFSRDTGLSLILDVQKGQRVVLNQAQELIVSDLRAASVTCVIWSGHECERIHVVSSSVDSRNALPAVHVAKSDEYN
ncbi:MAG: hypothetical protein O2931_08840 [Planctomycetota bacterium]|nr:hypothetical protein [Planctomycetota bacterium]MDA1178888.1 hypothetical protein [Planctomycetota bacterium]